MGLPVLWKAWQLGRRRWVRISEPLSTGIVGGSLEGAAMVQLNNAFFWQVLTAGGLNP